MFITIRPTAAPAPDAPTASTAPTITGTTQPGETVTVTKGTYSGTAPITVTGILTLDSVDVSGDMTGLTYTIPAGTVGDVLQWSETASNGTSPNATQNVSATITEAPASGAVVDQTATVGAKTLADAGAWQVQDSDGIAVTGASITGGTATGVSITSGGMITPDASGGLSAQDGNTISISCDQGTATVTLSVVANTYSCAADPAEIEAAYDDAAVTDLGVLVQDGGSYDHNSARFSPTPKAFTVPFRIRPSRTPAYNDDNPKSVVRKVNLPGVFLDAGCEFLHFEGIAFKNNILVFRPSAEIRVYQCHTQSESFYDVFDRGEMDSVRSADRTGVDFNIIGSGNHIRSRINNCYMRFCSRGFTTTAGGKNAAGDWCEVIGNWIEDSYSSHGRTGGSSYVKVWNNKGCDVWGASEDRPSDPVHLGEYSMDPNMNNISLIGNIAKIGSHRRIYQLAQLGTAPSQGYTGSKFNDPLNPTSYTDIYVAGNILLMASSASGIGLAVAGG